MQRVAVAGGNAAGKTTMARALAARLGLPCAEMDALRFDSDWVVRPEFEADVDALLAAGNWCTELQYGEVTQRLLATADVVVWLDCPWSLAAVRVVRRTARRVLTGTPAFGTATETFRGCLDRKHALWMVWSPRWWRVRAAVREELAGAAARGVPVVRLRGARSADRWLADVPARGTACAASSPGSTRCGTGMAVTGS
ncbi:hypothetical protein GCM10028783_34250 [Modestobacter muralis]